MAWVDTIFSFRALGRRSLSPPGIAAGELGELQIDANGNLQVSVVPSAPVLPRSRITTLSAQQAIVRSAPGALVELMGHNLTSTACFLHIFDRVTAPTAGLVPRQSYPIPAGALLFSYDFRTSLVQYGTGVTWATSSSHLTYTASAVTLYVESVTELCQAQS